MMIKLNLVAHLGRQSRRDELICTHRDKNGSFHNIMKNKPVQDALHNVDHGRQYRLRLTLFTGLLPPVTAGIFILLFFLEAWYRNVIFNTLRTHAKWKMMQTLMTMQMHPQTHT
jgi:hypothetical protein